MQVAPELEQHTRLLVLFFKALESPSFMPGTVK